MNICLVDDSRFQLMQTSQMLTDLGHDVTSFVVSREALESLKEKEYDCLVSDLLMPEMDGEQLVLELKKFKPNLPVIVITADIQKSVEKRCNDIGINFFLNKPVTKDQLDPVLSKIKLEAGE